MALCSKLSRLILGLALHWFKKTRSPHSGKNRKFPIFYGKLWSPRKNRDHWSQVSISRWLYFLKVVKMRTWWQLPLWETGTKNGKQRQKFIKMCLSCASSNAVSPMHGASFKKEQDENPLLSQSLKKLHFYFLLRKESPNFKLHKFINLLTRQVDPSIKELKKSQKNTPGEFPLNL